MNYECILVERRENAAGTLATGLVTLNRPKQLNALNDRLMDELGHALQGFDVDPGIGCVVITGSEKAFAAGADIGAMADYSYMDAYLGNYITRNWEALKNVRKPVIAAVAASPSAAAANWRWPATSSSRPTPRSSASPRSSSASFPAPAAPAPAACGRQGQGDGHGAHGPHDGRHRGRACRPGQPRGGRCRVARRGAGRRGHDLQLRHAQRDDGQAVRQPGLRVGPVDGVTYERGVFHSLFATEDQKEGMAAFVGKKKPVFRHR